ncbi:MAG TPA: glycosyl hydrolase [Acidimicrobiales bacterium]|nr:glycosyl hydrolase [Acidimicrobiales bacterium]
MRSRGERRRAMPLVAGFGSALISLTGLLGTSVLDGNPADAVTSAPTAEYSGGQMMAADPNGGYWTVDVAGDVTPYGGAPNFGSPAQSHIALSQPIVGMAATPDGAGYWLVASDGGIFSYGDAQFFGSTGAIHLNKPIVGMASTPDGAGYWLVASDGGIFSYGDAQFFGSTGAIHLNQPIVGMASTPDGGGYWLVASDGGIFSYGDASFYGSTGAIRLDQPIVGMADTPDGAGYWLVAADGGLFSYGDATFSGSTAGTGSNALGIVVNPPEYSYALVSRSGSATYFGRRHHDGTSNNGSVGTTTTTTTPAPTTTTTTTPPTTTTTTTPPPTTTTTTTPPPATTTTTTTPPTTTTTTTPSSSGLLLGSYDGAGNTSGAQSFASETHTTTSIYSDYLDGSSWSSMVGSAGSPPWVIGDIKGKLGSSRLEISVPLITAGFSSHQAALASYAGNPASWDANFTTLAKNLVSSGFSNAIIRLMWEPDSGTYNNEDLTSAANYATLWRDAYNSMMSVSGAQFQWAWYWGGNFDATTNNTAYPGDAYVNYVTFDFYDQSWDGSCGIAYNGSNFTSTQENCLWSRDFNGLLGKLTSFASSHSKQVGIGEFGVINRSDGHGGGDDPTFINNFSTWLKANNVAWASYFNFNSGGNSILSNYSNSLAAYQADLG